MARSKIKRKLNKKEQKMRNPFKFYTGREYNKENSEATREILKELKGGIKNEI